MGLVDRFPAYLFQGPAVPDDMLEYCESEITTANEARFRFLAPFGIASVSILLIIYLSLATINGLDRHLLSVIIADSTYLIFLSCCLIALFVRQHLKRPLNNILINVQFVGTLLWAAALSVLDNSVTTVIMALLVFAIAFTIKPHVYVTAQIVVLFAMIVVPMLLNRYDFTMLLNYINIIFCCALSVFLCRVAYNSAMESVASKRTIELQNIELKNISTTDSLTQIYNRRKFDEILQREWNRAIRNSLNLTLILLDIDYFKQYNDTRGHQKGDEVLALIGQALNSTFMRANEHAARWGGEEFACIISNADVEDGELACKRLLYSIEGLGIPYSDSAISDRVTVSAGMVAHVPGIDDTLHDFIKRADEALYAAKARGRNCYTVAGSESAPENRSGR